MGDPLELEQQRQCPSMASMAQPKMLAPELPPLPSEAERAQALARDDSASADHTHLPNAPKLPGMKNPPAISPTLLGTSGLTLPSFASEAGCGSSVPVHRLLPATQPDSGYTASSGLER